MFTVGIARLRFRVSIIGRLMWKPFDVEFGELISRLEEHKKLFEFEATFSVHEEALKFYARYDEEIQNAKRDNEARLREHLQASDEAEQRALQQRLCR